MYKKSIVLFRKDLRFQDNTALYEATKVSEHVFPLFVFDPRQVGNDNLYKSDNAIDFMVTSLQELDHDCKNYKGVFSFGYGHVIEYIERIFKTNRVDALFLNKDYTPFALERDGKIKTLCDQYQIAYHEYDDAVLYSPGSVMTGKNTPYTIFTPFFKVAITQQVLPSLHIRKYRFGHKQLESSESLHAVLKHFSYKKNEYKYVHGGIKEGKYIVQKLSDFKQYDKTRDFPSINTTYLAAHIKFGTVSVRQVLQAIVEKSHNSTLVKELYWREFFIQLAYHFPHVFKTTFRSEYSDLPWKHNKEHFKAWCEGKTGFPIVDAGMRQLNQTGFMHNRVRMIVASFLTKNLHISWQEGERYFAQKLTDYDPAVNNGNWQWAASTGADAQPYFRIFNPWLQQKRYDPECEYIKKWLPELANLSQEKIHSYYQNRDQIVKNYPLPIVDHAATSAYAKRFFKKY